MKMPTPGDYFEGKYEVLETLGEGGFAHVYRARDLEVGRDVAIKVLRPHEHGGYDSNVESRFAREARVIASLQDSHTITMYEFGKTAEGLNFMVFEYVRGQDLSDALKGHGALPPAIVEHILRQLLSALGEAHASGVLHRDIKPANVIVYEYMDDPWRVKLLDFGIAKPMPKADGRDFTQLTRDGAVIGTPRYMAPEQFFGDTLTARADIYGLGLLSYELLLGQPAIKGQSSQELVRQAVSTEPLAVPSVPGAEVLTPIIAKMIQRNPADRFGTADAVLAALDGARFAPPVMARPIQPSSSAGRATSPYSSEEYATTPRTPSDGSYPERPVFTTRTRRSRSRAVILFLLGLASVGIVGVLGIVLNERSTTPWSETPTVPDKPRRDVPFIASPEPPASPAVTELAVDAGPPNDQGTADGCGLPIDHTGFIERYAKLGFRSGTYTIYVPHGYDEHRRHPVILLFHNALGSGHGVIDDTRYNDIARRENVVLIAPTSTGDTSRPWYGADDLELVRTAYAQTRAELCLDDQHVYALGHGGGGNFVMELRCQFPLSAIAFSATGEHTTQEVCKTSEPVPALRLWGNKDRHVPPEGGQGCWDKNTFRSAEVVTELWQERNQTGSRSRTWIKERGGDCRQYEGKATFIDCELDGGHDWPTKPAKLELPGCSAPPPDFAMGDTIFRFFMEHGVPRHHWGVDDAEAGDLGQ